MLQLSDGRGSSTMTETGLGTWDSEGKCQSVLWYVIEVSELVVAILLSWRVTFFFFFDGTKYFSGWRHVTRWIT